MAIIRGQYLKADGTPESGWVKFTLIPPAMDGNLDQRTDTGVTVDLEWDGSFEVDLIPDADLLNVSGNAVYQVWEKVGDLDRSWHLLVADATELNLHEQYPGTEEEWTGVVLPPSGGGGGGTLNHSLLTNRTDADAHPTSAITGLDAALAAKLEATDLQAGTNVTLGTVGNTVTINASGGGGGVTDHGALTGLSDADHPIGAVQGLQTALDGKAATSHTHATGDVTGLDAALAGKLDPSEIVAGENITVDTATTPGSVIINAANGVVSASMQQGEWIWEASPSTPPMQTSNAGVNNDVVPSATQLYVHKLSVNSTDWSFLIGGMDDRWEVYAQDLDNANSWHRWGLTGAPTLSGDTWTLPVETIGGSPQGTEPNDNARILIGFVNPAITSHTALDDLTTGDPHTQYLLKTDAATAYAPVSHTHPASQISDSTAVGRSVVTAADAAAARTAIGAGTSNFDGAYGSLTGTPTLGSAASTDATDYATAAQGALADTSVQQDGTGSITTITAVTQAAYDLLSPPDANTFYVITG